MEMAKIRELDSKEVDGGKIRVFELSSWNGTRVELCNLGASVFRLMLPGGSNGGVEDCVLGYESVEAMYGSNNPSYLGVVVGRVANRIANGKFELNQESYDLELNFGPNHLHGGPDGFSRRLWDAHMDENNEVVTFTLQSPDGDQGYPGSVEVTATYRLSDDGNKSILHLTLQAKLSDSNKATPINLAQHSYFNLDRHDSPDGVLNHTLTLPSSDSYTPLNENSVPTKHVVSFQDDAAFMGFPQPRNISQALQDFAKHELGLDDAAANSIVTSRCKVTQDVDIQAVPPFGYDHNYVLKKDPAGKLHVAAVLETPKRRMTVYTDAPGLQFYSSNFMDGTVDSNHPFKDQATYHRWQAICLETQHYPDSIFSNDQIASQFPEFAQGKCVILRPGQDDKYEHNIEYHFEAK